MSKQSALLFLGVWIAGCAQQGGGGIRPDGAGAAPPEELAKLEGIWSGSVTMLRGDVPGGDVTVEFTADTVKIARQGAAAAAHLYSIDPTKNPKWIDFKGSPRSDPPMPTTRGIYELEGDQLKICMGGMRPTTFAGGDGTAMAIYKLSRK